MIKSEKSRMIATLLTAILMDKQTSIFNYDCFSYSNQLCNEQIWTQKWKNKSGHFIDLPSEIENIFNAGHNSIFTSTLEIYFA